MVDIGGMSTSPVLISPDFTKYTRKDKPDRYLNTPLFLDMWKQIKNDNTYSLYSWTIKADAATVFVPSALKKRLTLTQSHQLGCTLRHATKFLKVILAILRSSARMVWRGSWSRLRRTTTMQVSAG